jgi:hypothetical protein
MEIVWPNLGEEFEEDSSPNLASTRLFTVGGVADEAEQICQPLLVEGAYPHWRVWKIRGAYGET